MSDELKKFLQREFDELKQNKIRATALVACAATLAIFWLSDSPAPAEKISLDEPPVKAPATKDLPAKNFPPPKIFDGVKIVAGATSDPLIIANPFAAEKNSPPKKISPPKIPPPSKIPQEGSSNAPQGEIPPREKIFLTGTAISGAKKTAMFLRGKETIFRTVGDELDGRKIVDITADFVALSDGTRIYLQRE